MTIDPTRQQKCRDLAIQLSLRFTEFNWLSRIKSMPDKADFFWKLWGEFDEVLFEYMQGNSDWETVMVHARRLYCFTVPGE